MVEGDYIVAEGFGELEDALELGGGGAWRPGDVEVVEHWRCWVSLIDDIKISESGCILDK